MSAPDALSSRVLNDLERWRVWLDAAGVQGYLGEFGWTRLTDISDWNVLGELWYDEMDRYGIWGAPWSAKLYESSTTELSYYSNNQVTGDPLNTVRPGAAVVENHPATAQYRRGINVSGGERGGPVNDATSTFSNVNRGAFNGTGALDYRYLNSTDGAFLAGRGFDHLRLPFRWERIQPTLSAALDATEVSRLQAAIGVADDNGMSVVLDVHNYANYYLDNAGVGEKKSFDNGLTQAQFEDLWDRLSAVFSADARVMAYGLMNEPDLSTFSIWETYSQAAVDVIRGNGDNKLIMVGYENQIPTALTEHPLGWISDPSDNFRYEAHRYWDGVSGGAYTKPYDQEVGESQDDIAPNRYVGRVF